MGQVLTCGSKNRADSSLPETPDCEIAPYSFPVEKSAATISAPISKPIFSSADEDSILGNQLREALKLVSLSMILKIRSEENVLCDPLLENGY